MILTNYKKKNAYKEIIEKFSDENRLVSFGVVKSFISGKYKWLASYMFKGRNNTQTNKHRAFIGWFSDVEMTLNEYGSVQELASDVYFDRRIRPKFPQFYVEMSSKQYKTLGQEYAEYDTIQHVDLSGKILIDFINIGSENHVDVFHTYGDVPAFVSSGYKIPVLGGGYKYIKENPQVQVNLKFNNAEIVLSDNREDILTNPDILAYIAGSDNILNMPIVGYGDILSPAPILRHPWFYCSGEIESSLSIVEGEAEQT